MVIQAVRTKDLDSVNHEFFGTRMVKAGVITNNQRERVVSYQTTLKIKGKWVRFGDVAIEKGYCTANDIEGIPGFLGQKMIDLGFLDKKRQKALVDLQSRLRAKGFNIRYGDLCVSEGICSKEQVDSLLEEMA